MGIGPAHWTAFLRLSSRSCWLMNGSFLQGKMHCPDEWWDCLGTCWEKVWRIAKGVLDQPVKSFVSRPAQVLCPHLSPPYLSSFAFSCHPPSSPSVSHQTVASARREERQMWGAPQREGGAPAAYQSRDPCPDVTLPATVLQWLETGWTRFTGFHFGCTQILVYLSACTRVCENEK